MKVYVIKVAQSSFIPAICATREKAEEKFIELQTEWSTDVLFIQECEVEG